MKQNFLDLSRRRQKVMENKSEFKNRTGLADCQAARLIIWQALDLRKTKTKMFLVFISVMRMRIKRDLGISTKKGVKSC